MAGWRVLVLVLLAGLLVVAAGGVGHVVWRSEAADRREQEGRLDSLRLSVLETKRGGLLLQLRRELPAARKRTTGVNVTTDSTIRKILDEINAVEMDYNMIVMRHPDWHGRQLPFTAGPFD